LDTQDQLNESMEMQPEKEPSKAGLFAKRLLRRAVLWLGIFALGIVATWLVQVRPRAMEATDLKSEVQQLQDQVSDLEASLDELKGVEAERNELELHLSLLDILVDVSAAQLAINDGNFDTAQAALTDTDTKLSDLAGVLEQDYQETIDGMQSRLALALEEINQDAFAAESDLEVLRNSILALERSLFGD
jgi:polyhydroxyalkanoate synthesis regulator phasin